jgi:hypothetical protein
MNIEDCLMFLNILVPSAHQLHDVSLSQLTQCIKDIFYRILIVWHHSRFFSTKDRIKLIINKVRLLEIY